MIELRITHTFKPAGRNQIRQRCPSKTYSFPRLIEAKAFLKERYGRCKRTPMYLDTPDNTFQVGWVYHYKQTESYHGSPRTSYIEEWVTVYYVYRDHLRLNTKE